MCEKNKIFSFNKKDFRVDWYNPSKSGGQNINKNATACRIKHLETGLMTSSHEHKSAKQNKKSAFRKLVKLLITYYNPDTPKIRGKDEQKTRTYHECDNRIVDHVTGKKYPYKDTAGKGDISKIIQDRIDFNQSKDVDDAEK